MLTAQGGHFEVRTYRVSSDRPFSILLLLLRLLCAVFLTSCAHRTLAEDRWPRFAVRAHVQ